MVRKFSVALALSLVGALTGLAQQASKVEIVSIDAKLVMAGGFQVVAGNTGTLTAKDIEVCYETTNCGSVDMKVSLGVNYTVKVKTAIKGQDATVDVSVDLPVKTVTKAGLGGSGGTAQFCESIEDISVTGDEVAAKVKALTDSLFGTGGTLEGGKIIMETDYSQKFSVILLVHVECAGRTDPAKDDKSAGAQINQGDLKKGTAEKKLKFRR